MVAFRPIPVPSSALDCNWGAAYQRRNCLITKKWLFVWLLAFPLSNQQSTGQTGEHPALFDTIRSLDAKLFGAVNNHYAGVISPPFLCSAIAASWIAGSESPSFQTICSEWCADECRLRGKVPADDAASVDDHAGVENRDGVFPLHRDWSFCVRILDVRPRPIRNTSRRLRIN
jgi:hypothetical protein